MKKLILMVAFNSVM